MITSATTVLDGPFPPGMLRLGFGCGGLLHGLTRRESLYLLETALDCGITYFDTARMYGFGGAEGILGTIVPRNRHRICIASKAGILPPSRSLLLQIANQTIKACHKAVPRLRSVMPTLPGLQPRFGIFDLPGLRKSVETSLRELQTDYLDTLLLHECTAADVESDEVLYFLQELQKQGKIRKVGIATGIEETIRIAKARPLLSEVVQIASSIWNMNIKRLPPRPGGVTITHSTLTERFHALTRELSTNDALAKIWRSTIQIDPQNKVELARLLLAHALYSNPTGFVLFFSNNPKHIKASASVAIDNGVSPDQIRGLEALVKNDERIMCLEKLHRDHLTAS